MSSATATPIAVPVGAPTVQVVAPTNLDAGYVFYATYDEVVFPVTVPAGGVKEGQTFTVPFTAGSSGGEGAPLLLGSSDAATPQGRWKDGLCDCFTFGPCHPSLWNAICCPQILMAQVLTRLQMTWLGETTTTSSSADNNTDAWRMTFRRVLVLVVAYWLVTSFLGPTADDIVEADDDLGLMKDNTPQWKKSLHSLISFAFGLYTLVVMIRLRKAVRERYNIPTAEFAGSPPILEDCCCAFWCGCCTVSQLARQTADYQQRRAVCCSDTGLPPSYPVLIV